MVENKINADKGTPSEIVTDKVKVNAKNEPVGDANETLSNMENGDAPTGDENDTVLGNK